MKWKKATSLPWQAPLEFAAQFAGNDMALLYSGRQERYTGHGSYLLLAPLEHAKGSDWNLPKAEKGSPPDWVGYLGYGMRCADGLARGTASSIELPDYWLTRYAVLYHFDHEKQHIQQYTRGDAPITKKQSPLIAEVKKITSNMTRTEYKKIVRDTIDGIQEGDFYQANITRKFSGEFDKAPSSFAIFTKLCEASPAPYSAFIQHGDTAILSSSPECFLTLHEDGTITSRPIKGSAPRSDNAAHDEALRVALTRSGKNNAENLMIVDLMRNDLSQVSVPGTVEVKEQAGIYSYATIHHLVSTVAAQKSSSATVSEVIHACFPPGSMTGTPKRAAIEWCTAQEKIERGVYSGAIGWLSSDCCDLSVVIRTIVIKDKAFEFQVGGGIVAESEPDDEWRETLVKARGIAKALGITEKQLENL